MVEITIIDEVSGKFEAPLEIFCEVVEAMKLPEKGAFMTAAFQSGNWDGKVSLMDEEGFFDVFMIDIIEKVLQRNGIRDEDIKFTDMRLPVKHSREDLPETIDKDFFADHGVELWDHQVRFFNKFMDAECGIWDASTSSGKTLAMGGLAKLYDKFYPSLHLTVNQKLANDAAKVFKTLGLDYVVITAKTPVKKRQELINTHRHIITTRKLAMNMKDCFDEFQGVLSLDECYHPSHELLTRSGWKSIADIQIGDEVIAYDAETGQLRFEKAFHKIEKHFSGELLNLKSGEKYDLLVTPNHDQPVRSKKDSPMKKIKMKDFKKGMIIPYSGVYDGDDSHLSPLDRLRIAYEADGHLLYESVDGVTFTYRFTFRRERKIEQMRILLAENNIEYRLLTNKRGDTSFVFKSNLKLEKTLKWFDPFVSYNRNMEFLHEISLWDGSIVYQNSNKAATWEVKDQSEANFVCTVAHLCGHKATVKKYPSRNKTNSYSVYWSKKSEAKQTGNLPVEVPYDGMVYCVSVESGNLLTRRNGKIGISGNCHIYGSEFHEFAKEKLGDCPIRLGLSGSLPDKDKLKLQRIKNVINGGVIDEVLPGYLMEKGYASTIDVRMIEIDDLIGKRKMFEAGDEWCWEMELAHYGTEERIRVIGDFIEKNCPRNTLIITWNSTALELAKYLECDVIVDSTPQSEREEYFAKFDEVDDYRLVVTPGTGGFGVSIDLLYYGVLLDIGENPSVAGQGIGRFMRKDHVNGLKDHSVVWDIFSNLKSGKKQATGRRAYYKKRGIPFQPKYGKLKVTE